MKKEKKKKKKKKKRKKKKKIRNFCKTWSLCWHRDLMDIIYSVQK